MVDPRPHGGDVGVVGSEGNHPATSTLGCGDLALAAEPMKETPHGGGRRLGDLECLDPPIGPAQVQVIHHGFAAVVVETHFDLGQAGLHQLLGGLIVGSLRVSTSHDRWIIGADKSSDQRIR
jgi:hypothetical protein